jgi:arsenite methyltransferase
MKKEEVKPTVRKRYAGVVAKSSSCCGTSSSCGCSSPAETPSCCSSTPAETASCCVGSNLAEAASKKVGYSDKELNAVPEGANLGLGCGNPTALASLQPGETVLDLGSGAGFDCFLAANKVGKTGKVIGVDMTPEMIDRARENAAKGKYTNVEFRLGEIENLPAADNSIDAIISNCVINLAPEKDRVFREAFRVLKPGGRVMISDIVLEKELPEFIMNSIEAYVGCIAGAVTRTEYLAVLKAAGFKDVKVVDETTFPLDCVVSDPNAKAMIESLKVSPETIKDIAASIMSVKVQAKKPK